MSNTETYQDWANRETWALMLHINNDQGLYEMFRERVLDAADEGAMERLGAVQFLATDLLNPDDYRDEFGEAQPEGLQRMAHEVGSLWRVDWSEVVASLIES